jgi:hypothetical protein
MDTIRQTDYQLVLPEHLANSAYQEAYMEARRRGDYLILDNGAAEGELLSHGQLRSMALGLMVNEIVVPDSLGYMDDTLQLAKDFFRFGTDARFNYMGVIQGTTYAECCACVEAYSDQFSQISVLGIPRHLITTCEKDSIRADLAVFIRRRFGYGRFNVHLLGTSPHHIRELREYQSQFAVAGVRGVDTSAPFNYAYHAKSIIEGDASSRPDNYFDVRVNQSQALQYNIQLLKTWADA